MNRLSNLPPGCTDADIERNATAGDDDLPAGEAELYDVLVDINNYWAGGDCPKELWDRIQSVLATRHGRRP
jgi:hypothetical protein